MLLSEFDYVLPPELIAQHPADKRGGSRMLVLNPSNGNMDIVPFTRLPEYLNAGDAVTINNTKVIRARLFAQKNTGAKIEIFLLGLLDAAQGDKRWKCLLKPAKRVSEGSVLSLLSAENSEITPYSMTLLAKDPNGECSIEFSGADTDTILHHCGHIPIPPYIKRNDDSIDSERYQTIYAKEPGAVAAPTAGLHFTEEVFSALAEKQVRTAKLTLHVGAGTFKPVDEDVIENHKMHTERYVFTDETANLLNQTHKNGHKILAVGTTSLRTLESCVRQDGLFVPASGETDIFIYPPYKIRSADMLLTNFHLPKSTLLMLVSAFAGIENIRNAYRLAVQERMHFYSYGDCMLILDKVR